MRRILVIEDNPVVQTLVSSVLNHLGHEVVEAGDGAQGTRLFEKDRFDLVITDLMMPEQDGLTTVRAIRHRNTKVPILAMSGYPRAHEQDSYRQILMAFGANDTLLKPLDLGMLSQKVSTLLAA